jgi:hypothetical protein
MMPRRRKGEDVRHLPPGTGISVACGDDGRWVGELTADGVKVHGEGNGLMGTVSGLVRQWYRDHALRPRGEAARNGS